MIMHKVLIPTLIAGVIFSGCSTPPPGPAPEPEVISEEPYAPGVNTVEDAKKHHSLVGQTFTQVQLDSSLGQVLSTQEVRETQTKNGFTQVQVIMKSNAVGPLRVLHRFTWTNMDGVEVKDPAHDSWEKATVIAGDDLSLTSIAPSKDCKDYKLCIRLAVGN